MSGGFKSCSLPGEQYLRHGWLGPGSHRRSFARHAAASAVTPQHRSLQRSQDCQSPLLGMLGKPTAVPLVVGLSFTGAAFVALSMQHPKLIPSCNAPRLFRGVRRRVLTTKEDACPRWHPRKRAPLVQASRFLTLVRIRMVLPSLPPPVAPVPIGRMSELGIGVLRAWASHLNQGPAT